jgi:hypothetical protein
MLYAVGNSMPEATRPEESRTDGEISAGSALIPVLRENPVSGALHV